MIEKTAPIPSTSWTPQQLAGIQTIGCSLLVSAAAGSGKTAVLAERCAHLVCDPAHPCGIDELLVVTFTESAAAQMKTRIQHALRQRLSQHPTPRITRQLALAEHAHVSTLHGFCARILRQNFNLAGIDPEFQILDGDESALLRQEVAADLFHNRYDTDETRDFHRFVDAYGDGNDEFLIRQVIATHSLLTSLIDPEKWIEQTDAAMRESAEQPLEYTHLGRQLIDQIQLALDGLLRRCQDAHASIGTMGGAFSGYVAQLAELASMYAHWQEVLRHEGLDMLVSETRDSRAARPRAPVIRGQPPGKEVAKNLLDSVKNAVDAAPLTDLLAFTAIEWRQGMADVAPHARTFLWLVSEFTRQYSAAKQAVRALDFADLERLTLTILRDGQRQSLHPSALARSLHEQFRHVLVDEYQDINPIQDAILTLLSRECVSPENANLFCVGDVKQSIFRFRLAEPARFLDRHRRFSSTNGKSLGQVINLSENFRSRAPLLEAINGIFQRLMTRQAAEIEYDESHRLKAGRTFPPPGNLPCFSGAPIELHLLPKDPAEAADDEQPTDVEELERTDYEAILLARRIREMIGADGSAPMHVCKPDPSGIVRPMPIAYGDIVVLLRTMVKKADRFADILRSYGIPVHSEAGGGFFQATEVRDVLNLLQILDNQQQDIPLAAVLRSPLANLPNADDAMARVRLAYRQIPFHEAVRRYADEQDDELAARLRDFLDRLHDWRDHANQRPVAELLWKLYEETGYLAFNSGLEDGQQRFANLVHLYERAAQFGSFLRQGLYRFLRFLESLSEQKDVGRPSAAGDAEQVVRIMSIHRAKGLEFPVVLLPDLGKAHNLADAKGAILVDRAAGLGMAVIDEPRLIRYPSLASTLVRQSLLRQTLAEELRLLYVAATRAKEHLILVGTCDGTDWENWTSQWTARAGPLPSDVVLGGRRVLDWIGPVAAMTADTPSPIFDVRHHAAADVLAWQNLRDHRPPFSPQQQSMARLEKLPVDPPANPAATQVIQRFEKTYAHAPFSTRAATVSVTTLAKSAPTPSAHSNSATTPLRKLDLPPFFARDLKAKAIDVGKATHTVLQYFDFSGATQTSNIPHQIQNLIQQKRISPRDAKLVDTDAIRWFLQSDLGSLLRASHDKLMREVPFAVALAPGDSVPIADPLDQIMVRGRIDLLVPTPPGVSVVDYKTDDVAGSAIAARVESYERQMQLYSQAITQVARRQITAIYLVFLTPRQIVGIVPQPPVMAPVAP